MKKLYKVTVTALFVLATIIVPFGAVPSAHAASIRTWDGGGTDNKFSTAANWDGNTPLQTGQIIKFDQVLTPDSGVSNVITVVNDTNLVLAGVTGGGTTTNQYGNAEMYYRIDKVKLQTDSHIVNPVNSKAAVRVDTVESTGDISISHANVGDASAQSITVLSSSSTGNLSAQMVTIKNNASLTSVASVFDNVESITIENGGFLDMYSSPNFAQTLNTNLLLGGGEGGANDFLGTINPTVRLVCGGTTDNCDSGPITLNGNIILSHDSDFKSQKNTVTLNSRLVANGHTLNVDISDGGTLKGSGVTGAVKLSTGSSIQPGNSPGVLTMMSLELDETSSASFEFAGVNNGEYDQIVSAGPVKLGSATLNVIASGNLNIASGLTFMIIDNQSNSPINGTFKDLPEGATIKVSNIEFKISYVGGDGNDVVLANSQQDATATVPSTPNTSLFRLPGSPVAVLVYGIAVAVVVAFATRSRRSSARR